MILSSCYIYVPVSNLRRAAKWYSETFGFELFFEDSAFYELRSGSGIRVLLILNENNINSQMKYSNGYQPAYGFTVPDINSIRQQLADKGVKVDEIIDYAGLSFSFHDPDGNIIELWNRNE